MISPQVFSLLCALGVLLAWSAVTSPPRVDVASALALGEKRRASGWLARLDAHFERARLPVTARELISSGLVLGGVAGALALIVTRQIAFAALVAALGPAILYLRAESRRDQAERDYQEALVQAMDVIRSSYSTVPDVRAALGDAARYAPALIRPDFEQADALLLQGANLEEALAPVQARRRNIFLDMIVEALTQREQQGGSISDVLANIQELIREQGRIFQRTMARQTQARIETTIVCLAPAFFFIFIRTLFRDYEQGFYDTVTGQLILIAAFLLDGAAYVISRKIARSGLEIARYEVS